jgi:Tol biopolymer transport system component
MRRALAWGAALGMALMTSALAARVPLSRLTTLRQGASEPGNVSDGASISADGRFIAFVSEAPLLPADSNGAPDVYVFDRVRGLLTIETVAPDGSASNARSCHPGLSADGRYLVFESDATNLTTERRYDLDSNVFLRDRLTGVTQRLGTGPKLAPPNGASESPVISDDGNVVVFASHATNLVEGVDENGSGRDIYLVHIRSGDVRRVSIDSKGRQAAVGESIAPTLSGDGRVVAFGSTAPIGQSSAPHSSTLAVFVRDLASGRTTCASCRGESSVTAGQAFGAHLSGDGRFLAFTVQTDHGPLPRRTDIVVRDLTTAAATVITNFANGPSTRPKLSGDGRFVVFESQASNLVCQSRCAKGELDVNLLSDIYMLDQRTGRFARVSGNPEQWWFPSIAPSIDASGCVVAFSSRQPFGPEDPTTDFDLFVRMCDEATPGARTAVVRTDRTGAERVTCVGFAARLPRPVETSSLFGHADCCRVTAWCARLVSPAARIPSGSKEKLDSWRRCNWGKRT